MSSTFNVDSKFTAPNSRRAFSTSKFVYSDEHIKSILGSTKVIAMVGASTNWTRPSYFAMKYLQQKGYRTIPINPGAVGKEILGEKVYGTLDDVVEAGIEIDMVDAFRKSEDTPAIAKEAVKIGAKTLWLQLGVFNDEAKEIAKAGGLNVIMDRCPKIEYSRIYGELGWLGVDSKIISSKRRGASSSSSSTVTGGPGDIEPPQFTGFDTKTIHSGSSPCPSTGSRSTPIYQTTAYVFDSVDHAASLFNLQTPGNIYSRLSNPTTAVLEERICALEGGRGATCTSSGHAAQLLALFPLMQPGDKIVASNKLYGGSLTQFGKTFLKFGWGCEFVDVDDIDQVRRALNTDSEKVKALWVESLANPAGAVTDIEAMAKEAHAIGVPLIVDNTMATPYLCKPIDYGADLVTHSTTKFLSGHGNAMGGCIVDSGTFDWAQNEKFPSLSAPETAYHGLKFAESFGDLAYTMHSHAVGLRDLGPTMAPINAFLTITGCETLPLRMQKHADNSILVAEWLEKDPRVEEVTYSGLKSSKYYELTKKYTPLGAGSVFTFRIKGGFEAGVRVVERCQLFSHLANIGDTRSLILHPASTTHRQLETSQRIKAGAGDDVLRLSIGLESVEDLIKDLDYALAGVTMMTKDSSTNTESDSSEGQKVTA